MHAAGEVFWTRNNRLQFLSLAVLTAGLWILLAVPVSAQQPLRERLKELPYKIAYESYVNSNWEIFVMNADGSNPANLTQSPTLHEHYPQISPDGTRI